MFDALRRAPGPANDEAEEGLGALTAREREVLNLLARGLSNRDIAEELVITNKTVKNHLSRIYEKIGVHSRAEAIALWLGVREILSPGPTRIWDPGPRPKLSPAPLAGPRGRPSFLAQSSSTASTQEAQAMQTHHPSHRGDRSARPASAVRARDRTRIVERAREERGQTAAEYMGILLIVALIIGAIVTVGIGNKIADLIDGMITSISSGDKKAQRRPVI